MLNTDGSRKGAERKFLKLIICIHHANKVKQNVKIRKIKKSTEFLTNVAFFLKKKRVKTRLLVFSIIEDKFNNKTFILFLIF